MNIIMIVIGGAFLFVVSAIVYVATGYAIGWFALIKFIRCSNRKALSWRYSMFDLPLGPGCPFRLSTASAASAALTVA